MKQLSHAMNPDDKTRSDETPDTLDAMLSARPVRPSADFANRTLARLDRMRAEADPELDRLLASRPVGAPAGFAQRVMDTIAAERRRKFVLFRVVAPAALAACLALAALPAFGPSRRPESADARLSAAVNADAELRALAALPEGANTPKTPTASDIATFAALDAALAANSTEYAYGI